MIQMIHELRAALLGVSAYRAVTAEPLMGAVRELLDALVKSRGEAALAAYTEIFTVCARRERRGWGIGSTTPCAIWTDPIPPP